GEFRLINRSGGLADYFIILRRYGMFFYFFDSDGLESRITDVMRNFNDLHAASAQFVESSPGEMQSGGRRRNRSAFAGEDGLIAGLVQSMFFAAFASDVWRQRRIADLVNDPVEILIALKTNVTATFF